MRRLLLSIPVTTLSAVLLAIASTWVCSRFGLVGNFSVTFLLTAVIVPVVLSIHSADNAARRHSGISPPGKPAGGLSTLPCATGSISPGGLLNVMPGLFPVVLTALVNNQTPLENPFDQFGEEDVVFNTRCFIASLKQD